MVKRNLIILCLLSFVASVSLNAQVYSRYNTFSYGVNEGLLQSTIIDTEFDRNNYWWLSYPNGIQRFDGKNFISVPVQPGLPENKNCSFFRCSNGTLLVGHLQGISRYDDKTNAFHLVYKFEQTAIATARFVGEYRGVIYLYTEAAEIIGINMSSYARISRFKTGLPGYEKDLDYAPKVSGSIVDGKTAMIINKKIYCWGMAEGKFLYESAAFPDISFYVLQQISKNELLFYDKNKKGALQILNIQANAIRNIPIEEQPQIAISRCIIYHWQQKILLSLNDRIYETDSSLSQISAEIVNYQNAPPAKDATIANLKQDNFGNLYVQTISGGFRKITADNYPLKYYGAGAIDKKFTLAILPDERNNRILTGASGNGLLIYDSMQRLVKHIPMPAPDGSGFYSPTAIIKSKAGEYYIFTPGSKGLWKLGSDLNRMQLLPFISKLAPEKSGVGYFCKTLYQDEEKAVVLSQANIYRVDFSGNKVYEYPSANGYIMSGVYCKPYYMIHCNDEFIFLDEHDFSIVKRRPFNNTGGVRCYLNNDSGKIFVGTNKGIFVTDTEGRLLQYFSRESGLPDECIYAMAFDKKGNTWCSTNKGIFKLEAGKVTEHLKKEDGLQENEFNTNVVAASASGELFFGGVNGVSSFYPERITRHSENINLLFTNILANNQDVSKDSAAWSLKKIKLPYTLNSLAFDFVAMGSLNPGQYVYQYRMKGVDNEWSYNNGLQTVHYSLPPGKYVFQVYASKGHSNTPVPMKELFIVIDPPFWKTWWFISLLAIVFAFSLGYIINQRNKRLYAKKMQQLENEKQLREERERISRDLHDSLGAYAHAILYNTELLEAEHEESRRKELLGGLKYASKDIITSLRETIWALKKESYSAEECLVRIRNFIQPLARYYSHTQFNMVGEAPPAFSLHYSKALNLVRIIQEAISNSIKHANADMITVSSSYNESAWTLQIDDNGKGFNSSDPGSEKGNGLYNMEHRAVESGFFYKMIAKQGSGTQILITIQL